MCDENGNWRQPVRAHLIHEHDGVLIADDLLYGLTTTVTLLH